MQNQDKQDQTDEREKCTDENNTNARAWWEKARGCRCSPDGRHQWFESSKVITPQSENLVSIICVNCFHVVNLSEASLFLESHSHLQSDDRHQ